MSDYKISDDGKWVWNGKEWLPIPNQPEVNPSEQSNIPSMIDLDSLLPKEDVTAKTIHIQDSVIQGDINQNIIHQTYSNGEGQQNSNLESVDIQTKQFDMLVVSSLVSVLLHIGWIGLSVFIISKMEDPNFTESQINNLITWGVIIYAISALATFYTKFQIENSDEDNNGYAYINTLCQKSLLIPFAIIALIAVICFYMLKLFFQFALESTKQASYKGRSSTFGNTQRSSGSQQFVCSRCGNVKAGWRLNAICCGRQMGKL